MTIARDNRQVVDAQAPHHYPNSDLDMWERLTTFHFGGLGAITDHFRGAALLPGWTWAGAPFVVPTVGLANSILSVRFNAANRGFLYQATPAGNKLASVSLSSFTVGFATGLRLDDGSDNNYAEVVLRVSQASPAQWAVQARYRAGGGVVTTADGDAMSEAELHTLYLQVLGAWTPPAWGFLPALFSQVGIAMYKPLTDLAAGAAAWTPTRAGLIFDALAWSSAYETAYVDWCDLSV